MPSYSQRWAAQTQATTETDTDSSASPPKQEKQAPAPTKAEQRQEAKRLRGVERAKKRREQAAKRATKQAERSERHMAAYHAESAKNRARHAEKLAEDPFYGASMLQAKNKVVKLSKDSIRMSPSAKDSWGVTRKLDHSVSACVETAGGLTNRTTATRVAAGAVVAGPLGAVIGAIAKKRVDTCELYLVIEAADWAELIEVNPDNGPAARRFAQSINLAAAQLSVTQAESSDQ